MAIPKQPRQLMINIMYLVLTALLALNVSAEVFNAFKMVNHGLQDSNDALDKASESMPALIKDGSKKRKDLEKWADLADKPSEISSEFSEYVQGILDGLIDEAGNGNGTIDDGDFVVYGEKKKYRGIKNKDVPTRLLVNQGKGLELKERILETKRKLLEIVEPEDTARILAQMSLGIDDESWRHTKKKSWEEFTFKQMPLGACEPIFTKIINDAKSSGNVILNYMLEKVGTDNIVVLDRFTVSSSPKKSYVIKGEPFETDVFMSASASKESNTDVNISVNGRSLPVDKDGVATWKTVPSTVGIKKYTAVVTMKNPVTEEVETFKKIFEFEVGERSCNVSAEKMNVFYIGVDNPVAVSAAGVPSSQLKVSASGSGIAMTKVGGSKYSVTVKKPGESTITVSGGGLQSTKFSFRVKRIPDPTAKLSKHKGGSINSGVFKAQAGVIAALDGFDFDAKCKIMGFQLVRIAKRQDAEIAINRGGRFGGDASGLMTKAKPGDKFFFENVKAKCPGDAAGRKINDMIFNIK